jgi:hypothetical protein
MSAGTYRHIAAETVDALSEALLQLQPGETAYITATDYRHLTGEDFTSLLGEGRFMIGNTASRSSCTLRNEDDRLLFTKLARR